MPGIQKPTPKAKPKAARQFDKADRSKMKIYGDVPDNRPKGRVYTPELMDATKRLRKKKGVGI